MVPSRFFLYGVAIFAMLVVSTALAVSPALANERILSNPRYQLALHGYDPVAYSADGEARVGVEDHELLYQDLVWRFANEGNKSAFEADPDRYIPAYGGYCALGAAEGLAAAARPEIYVNLGGRVFLFRSPATRYAFLLEADSLVTRADALWPGVLQTLSP